MTSDISVVVPCHNEEAVLPEVVATLRDWVSRAPVPVQVVFVENGSSDATFAVACAARDAWAEGSSVEVLSLPVGDYGAAVRAGLKVATGTFVAVLDCDMVDTVFVERCHGLLADDGRLGAVLASKRAAGAKDERSAYRRAGTLVFSSLVRLLTGSSLVDTHGNKMFRGDATRAFVDEVEEDGSLFDTELLVRMERAGWAFAELPATVVETRPPRSSYLSRVPAAVRGLLRLRSRLGSRGPSARMSSSVPPGR